jgi:hypothetical protein
MKRRRLDEACRDHGRECQAKAVSMHCIFKEYRQGERQRDAEVTRRLHEDEEYRDAKRQRHVEEHRRFRADEQYRDAERQRHIKENRRFRADEQYRDAERRQVKQAVSC